jgi:hypothetical protein
VFLLFFDDDVDDTPKLLRLVVSGCRVPGMMTFNSERHDSNKRKRRTGAERPIDVPELKVSQSSRFIDS